MLNIFTAGYIAECGVLHATVAVNTRHVQSKSCYSMTKLLIHGHNLSTNPSTHHIAVSPSSILSPTRTAIHTH